MKDLSIIVPLYNKVNYIYNCLSSIKDSIHNISYECLIIDDGSDDGSSDIAVAFANENPDTFTYIKCLRNHKRYPSYARNLGIRLADSKYMMFFDADDLICDGYPDRGIEWMEVNTDYDLYVESFYRVYDEQDHMFSFVTFQPYMPKSCMDFISFLETGGGIYTRGIFRSEHAKKCHYKEMDIEDSIFLIDYLYPCTKYHLEQDQYSFYYFDCRSEQDAIVHKDGLDDRQFIFDYVKAEYPDFYKAFLDRNN